MRQRDDMTFPFEEYERRITALRERMEKRLLENIKSTFTTTRSTRSDEVVTQPSSK